LKIGVEKIYYKHRVLIGLLVDKVEHGSPADLSGFSDGDIIIEFCGKPAAFLAQCAKVLFDKSTFLEFPCFRPKLTFEVKILRGEIEKCLTLYTDQTVRRCHFNRWPLPKVHRERIPMITALFRLGTNCPSTLWNFFVAFGFDTAVDVDSAYRSADGKGISSVLYKYALRQNAADVHDLLTLLLYVTNGVVFNSCFVSNTKIEYSFFRLDQYV
ncbi:hypothetical protein SOVF_113060, partial [Spinacia oleracea]